MKRKFKRIASLVLAMVMVFAMAMPAMAAEGTTHSITITNAADGSSFTAYQIFAGTIDTAGDTLSNVVWGNGLNNAGQEELAKAVLGDPLPDDHSAAAVAKALEGKKGYELQQIFGEIKPENLTNGTDAAASGEEDVFSSLAPGYYLIVDSATEGAGFIVRLLDRDERIESKTDVPKSEKSVKDINDSDGKGETGWQDIADYDITDEVPFQLKATVASNYAQYESYYFAFHDVQSPGLTFNPGSVVVKVGDVTLNKNTDYKVVTPAEPETTLTDGCTFEIVFDDLKDVPSVEAGSVITVEYTSTLNEGAVIGNPGNPNKMHLEYSNSPQTPTDRGNTPTSTVVVFTFDVNVDKVDENGNPLSGAEFTLDKYNAAGKFWNSIAKLEITSETQFNFKGVDDGVYRLKETGTPDGYNTIDPSEIYIKVEATHTKDGVTELKATVGTAYNTETGEISGEVKGVVNFTANTVELESGTQTKESIEDMTNSGEAGKIGSYGWLTTGVINRTGATLPETGGIGTTIFYVVGSVLVLGAVILLVTKRRMKG